MAGITLGLGMPHSLQPGTKPDNWPHHTQRDQHMPWLYDAATLQPLPKARLNSSTSAIRNWITMSGASEHLGVQCTDFVPCYRSPAGTGYATGFGAWGQ